MSTPGADWVVDDLTVRSRRGRRVVHFRDGRPVLDGRSNWVVEGPHGKVSEIVDFASGFSERLTDRTILLDFGNAVGRFPIPYLGTVEVTSGKWGRIAFDGMMQDLVARAADLPFTAGAAGALPYSRTAANRERILYHSFAYLRYVLSDQTPNEERLDTSYRLVLREPHREWRRGRRSVPIGRAHRIDAKSLHDMAGASTGYADLTGARAKPNVVSRALGGRLPVDVDERRDYASVDTPENRFLKLFLGQIQRIVEDVAAVAEGSDRLLLKHRVRRECDDIRRQLRPIVRHSLWSEIGTMASLPSGSTVLQRRRGYRDIYRHFARLRMASRLPLSEDEASSLLEIKDIALLYELWCYFRLVSALEELIGRPVQAATVQRSPLEPTVRWGTQVRWSNGVRLLYNPRFSRSRSPRRRSYSVPLRPDILLQVPRGPEAGFHVLDAKFKIRRVSDAIPSGEESDREREDAETAERRGDFKRGDLYKMHTYRDALPGVRSVWILYPGSVARFFSTSGDTWDAAGDLLPEVMKGVGALPASPDRDYEAVTSVFRRLLAL